MSKQNKTKAELFSPPLPRSSVGQSHRLPLAALRGFALFFFLRKGTSLRFRLLFRSLSLRASKRASERESSPHRTLRKIHNPPSQRGRRECLSVCPCVCVCVCLCLSVSACICLSICLFALEGEGGEGRGGGAWRGSPQRGVKTVRESGKRSTTRATSSICPTHAATNNHEQEGKRKGRRSE